MTMQTGISRIPSRLRRVTSSGNFIPEIDGLRFFAIALVVLLHTVKLYELDSGTDLSGNLPADIALHGGVGVRLFFVISGFILVLPFARHFLEGGRPVSLKKYYLRRLTRLEPPYVIALTMWLMVAALAKHKPLLESLPHYFSGITYSHFFFYLRPNDLFFASWSLEVEAQFYVLAPFLAYIFAVENRLARRLAMVSAIFAFSLLQLFLSGRARELLWFTLPAQLPLFLTGFLLAEIYIAWGPRASRGRNLYFDAVASAAFLCILLLFKFNLNQCWDMLALAALVFLFYLSCFNGVCWNAVVTNKWIVATGGMCYSIYLFHRAVLYFFRGPVFSRMRLPGPPCIGATIQICLMLLATAVCGAAIFLAVEKPFMRRDWHLSLFNRVKQACLAQAD